MCLWPIERTKYARSHNSPCLDPFFPTSHPREEVKTFGCLWDWTPGHCVTSELFYHYPMASRALWKLVAQAMDSYSTGGTGPGKATILAKIGLQFSAPLVLAGWGYQVHYKWRCNARIKTSSQGCLRLTLDAMDTACRATSILARCRHIVIIL